MTLSKDSECLNRGVDSVLPSREELVKLVESKKSLRIYFGIDPTSPTLHIGHAIGLRKLREFQKMGHEVILLIGSFTAMIGDPTDKSAARVQLTREQVMENAATYKAQASKILDFDGENPATLMFNHEWLGEMKFEDVLNLSSHFTVQQMAERDMFSRRIEAGKPVYLHEFLYPLMQGYDSVHMGVDLEIGGSDQIFNMLAGRTLVRQMDVGREKFVLSLTLLENAEGKKMSKTASGFIALNDTPKEMFGKLMAMDDSMILPYAQLVTDLDEAQIADMETRLKKGDNPRDIKAELAVRVVNMYNEKGAGEAALEEFNNIFQKGAMPDEMDEFVLEESVGIIDLLVRTGLCSSNSDARRMLQQNAVKLDSEVVQDGVSIDIASLPVVLQKGKRHFVKIISA